MKIGVCHKCFVNDCTFIKKKSLRVAGLSSAFYFGICFVFVVLILFARGKIGINLGRKKGAPATISQFAIGI